MSAKDAMLKLLKDNLNRNLEDLSWFLQPDILQKQLQELSDNCLPNTSGMYHVEKG